MPKLTISPLLLYLQQLPYTFQQHAKELLRNDRYRASFHADVAAMPYADYLQSDAWRLTVQLLRIYQPRCEKCGRTKDLETHHLTYERYGIEVLCLCDLQVLCASCHAAAETPRAHDPETCDLCGMALWLPATPAQLWFPAPDKSRRVA